jgi:phosphomannomutase
MTAFCFDVDGTLTPSREKIDHQFKIFFFDWVLNTALSENDQVFLVSGSDYAKTVEQVGTGICNNVDGVFSCAGNIMYIMGTEEYRNDFKLTDSERAALKNELYHSGFTLRTGNHIEERIGLVNFSIVGRNATKQEREIYKLWDEQTHEREEIAKRLNSMFTRLECVVGGETGLDIYLKGRDKSQIVDWIENRPLVFFGDKCEPGGNDYPLAKVANVCYHVKSWQETWEILKEKYSEKG